MGDSEYVSSVNKLAASMLTKEYLHEVFKRVPNVSMPQDYYSHAKFAPVIYF